MSMMMMIDEGENEDEQEALNVFWESVGLSQG